MDLTKVIDNTKEIYMSDTSLSTLMDFEELMDNVDIYAFANWLSGELVEGPVVDKYWISCTFMWPYKLMPDPRGGYRLLDHGCQITYEKDTIQTPVEIEKPEDFEPGTKKARMQDHDVWLVKITMPAEIIKTPRPGYVELGGKPVDMQGVDDAMESGLDSDGAVDGTAEDEAEDDDLEGLDF